MTAPARFGAAPPGAEPDEDLAGPPAYADTAERRPPTWRRVLTVVGWVVAVTLGGLLLALAAGRPAPDEYLHPDGTGAGGTRALVEVLRDHGIDVQVVGTTDEVVAATGPGTTVVVGNSELLTTTSAERLFDDTATADRIVLLDAAPGILHELGLGLRAEPPSAEVTEQCAAPWADDGDRLSHVSWALVPEGGPLPDDATGCFPVPGQRTPGQDAPAQGYAVVDLPATGPRPAVTVVGAPDAATNRFVTDDENAGLLVRLLGGSPRLVWFHPSAEDLAANPPADGGSVWPDWVGPVVALVAVAFAVFAVARGRRLGRLVKEPLPVVVRAAETTESRAELYRAAQDRPRAAVVLRRATSARLAARLGLTASAPPSALVPVVADATGVPAVEVESLLVGPLPVDDAGLVALAQQLAHLEEKARRP